MDEKEYPFDRRALYAFLLIIIVLSLLAHLTFGTILSLVTTYLIIVLAISNISYLYMKLKKRTK